MKKILGCAYELCYENSKLNLDDLKYRVEILAQM